MASKYTLNIPDNAKTFTMTLPVSVVADLDRLVQKLFPGRDSSYRMLASIDKPEYSDQFIYYVFMLASGLKYHYKLDDTNWGKTFLDFYNERVPFIRKHNANIDTLNNEQLDMVQKDVIKSVIEPAVSDEVELQLSNGSKVKIPKENHDIICATAVSSGIQIDQLTNDDIYVLSDSRDNTVGKAAYVKEIASHIDKIKERLTKVHRIEDDESFSMTCAEGLILSTNADQKKIDEYMQKAGEKHNFIHIREKAY